MQMAGVLNLSAASTLPQITVHNLPITIEHPKGTQRVLKGDDGKVVYSKHMYAHYGFFNGTKGRDGDEVDCFVGPMKNAKEVYIAHMKDLGPVPSEREDEDKCFIGYPSAEAAKQSFLQHYPKTFLESMTVLPVDTFKAKLRSASLPYHKRKIHATIALGAKACPHCRSKKFSLMPTDFETAKCKTCGKTFPYMEVKAEINPKIKYGGAGGVADGVSPL